MEDKNIKRPPTLSRWSFNKLSYSMTVYLALLIVIFLLYSQDISAEQEENLSNPQQSSSISSSLEDLLGLFGVDLPMADVVILLDASGSMMKEERYKMVRQGAVNFVSSLTDKENLHLRVFADAPTAPLEDRGAEAAKRVDSFLPQAAFPKGRTDLGLAIEKGLEFLGREGASNVQVFFLFTDGKHEPPSDSVYSNSFDRDEDWLSLRQKGHNLCSQHIIFVYGFGIGAQTDIAVLRKIFPASNVELVVGSASEITNILNQVRKRIQRAYLRQAVEKELEEGKIESNLSLRSVSGNVKFYNLKLKNTYQHLPVKLEKIDIENKVGKDIDFVINDIPSNFTLEPGKEWQGKVKSTLQKSISRWHIRKGEENYKANSEFNVIAGFQHEGSLKELGIDPVLPMVNKPILTEEFNVRYGIGILTTVAGFLFLVLLILAIIKRETKIVNIELDLNLEDWPAGLETQRRWRFPANEMTYTIGSDDKAHIKLPKIEPQHGQIRIGNDGMVTINEINGRVEIIENQRNDRMVFRIGNYCFELRVNRTKHILWFRWALRGVCVVLLAVVILAYFFGP